MQQSGGRRARRRRATNRCARRERRSAWRSASLEAIGGPARLHARRSRDERPRQCAGRRTTSTRERTFQPASCKDVAQRHHRLRAVLTDDRRFERPVHDDPRQWVAPNTTWNIQAVLSVPIWTRYATAPCNNQALDEAKNNVEAAEQRDRRRHPGQAQRRGVRHAERGRSIRRARPTPTSTLQDPRRHRVGGEVTSLDLLARRGEPARGGDQPRAEAGGDGRAKLAAALTLSFCHR